MIQTYIINRESRKDRLTDITEQLRLQGMNGHLFKAIEGGFTGCRDSHIALLEKCKNEKMFLILEDDALFVEDINPYLQLAMEQLPSNFDLLYLGGSPQKPQEKYSDNLFVARDVKTTHAILWHPRWNGAVDWILHHKDYIQKWDVFLMEWIQPCYNCYLTYPLMVTQRQTKSDIAKRSDCSTILKQYKKFCI